MRLIRPISSRLTALRREHEVREAVAREARVAAAAVAKANLAPVQARKPRGFDKVRDPDWVPGAKPTGVSKRTYGGRPAKKMNEVRWRRTHEHHTYFANLLVDETAIGASGTPRRNTFHTHRVPKQRLHGRGRMQCISHTAKEERTFGRNT